MKGQPTKWEKTFSNHKCDKIIVSKIHKELIQFDGFVYTRTHTHTHTHVNMFKGFPGGLVSKESTCSAGDPGLIPGLGISPG